MMVQITLSGSIQRLSVDQVEFVRICHYSRCEKEFLTIDPDQRYCMPNHVIYQSKLRRILRESPSVTPSLPALRCHLANR